jgi:hypothetical protein
MFLDSGNAKTVHRLVIQASETDADASAEPHEWCRGRRRRCLPAVLCKARATHGAPSAAGRVVGGQTYLDKPQSAISRIEDPDYGKLSLQTLFDLAKVYDLPLLVQFVEWPDWLNRMEEVSTEALQKESFNADELSALSSLQFTTGCTTNLDRFYLNSGILGVGHVLNVSRLHSISVGPITVGVLQSATEVSWENLEGEWDDLFEQVSGQPVQDMEVAGHG